MQDIFNFAFDFLNLSSILHYEYRSEMPKSCNLLLHIKVNKSIKIDKCQKKSLNSYSNYWNLNKLGFPTDGITRTMCT